MCYDVTIGRDGRPVYPDMRVISEVEAGDLVIRELESSEWIVLRLVKTGLTENQFSALVSFTFNVGAGALQPGTLRMKLNRGELVRLISSQSGVGKGGEY